MLSSFENRERAAELIFVLGEEKRFDTECYGIRAVAALAINRLGVDRGTYDVYARALLEARVEGVKDIALLQRVQADLAANGVDISINELKDEMTNRKRSDFDRLRYLS